MKKLAFIATVVASIFVGCKSSQYSSQTQAAGKETKEADAQRIPLTTGLIQQYSLTGEHLQKLQFFIEGTIVLSANQEARSLAVEGGDLVVKQTTRPLDVQVKNQSPGVFQGLNKQAIAVRFEQDGNNRFLWFMPGQDGRYYLAGVQNGTGLIVKYDDRDYFADATSRTAYLSINVRQISELDPQKRIAPGVRLGESGSGSNGVNSTSSGFVIPNGSTNQAGTGPGTEPFFVPAPAQSSQPAQNPTPPSGGGGGIKGKTF